MEEERRPGGVAVESAKCRRDEEWKNGWEQRDRRRQRSPRHTPHRCVGKSDDRWAGAGNGVSWKHRPLWTFTHRGPIELSMDCRWAEKDRRWAFSCPSVIPSKSWPRWGPVNFWGSDCSVYRLNAAFLIGAVDSEVSWRVDQRSVNGNSKHSCTNDDALSLTGSPSHRRRDHVFFARTIPGGIVGPMTSNAQVYVEPVARRWESEKTIENTVIVSNILLVSFLRPHARSAHGLHFSSLKLQLGQESQTGQMSKEVAERRWSFHGIYYSL